MTSLALPERVGRGIRPGTPRYDAYLASVEAWCDALIDLKAGLEVDPGVRGWCYILEPHGLSKGDFDRACTLISDCRKSGLLPLDFTTDDTASKWAFDHVEEINDETPQDAAERVADYVRSAEDYYDPVSFWDFQDHYVEMLVEKSSAKGLFSPVCGQYHVPIGIGGGCWSINMRANLLKRIAEKQAAGNECVLLYCGDHDPHGLRIAKSLRSNLEDVRDAFEATFDEGIDLDALEIDRFGLDADFVDRHNLSWIDGLITGSGKDLADPNHRSDRKQDGDVLDYIRRFGTRKVEIEALVTKPKVARSLCKKAILQYVDQDGIDEFKRARDERRAEMRKQIAKTFEGWAQ